MHEGGVGNWGTVLLLSAPKDPRVGLCGMPHGHILSIL